MERQTDRQRQQTDTAREKTRSERERVFGWLVFVLRPINSEVI